MAPGPWETPRPRPEQTASDGSRPSAVSLHAEVKTLQAATLSFLHKPAQRSAKFFLIWVKSPMGQETWKLGGEQH